jgi:methionyl aminopeptidase
MHVIQIKTPQQIDGIRKSSKLAAEVLKYLAVFLRVGITTEELNQIAHKYIIDHGAIPAPLGYNGYPKSICTSVNNIVCHGIPSKDQTLKDGDIINLDITTILNGFYGDTSATYTIGNVSPEVKKLIETTKESLNKSIKCLKPGKYLNDCVGKIIEPLAKSRGYSIVRELGGHGVGLMFHEDPFVYHYDTKKKDVILKPGMIFTIEPMINGSPDARVTMDAIDGWTIRTYDGSVSAQFEHTVLITQNGSEILTSFQENFNH